ncbi:homoserine kinase [Staphylococcus chromogenes]|nr:homoserine kinase [Staphylococcus chromogenes]
MSTVPPGKKIAVRVPASSANLGPGFDSLGLALGLYDDLTFEVIDSGIEGSISGEGAAHLQVTGDHLVVAAFRRALHAVGIDLPGVRLTCHNRIPHSRGLGSSASAAVAGVVAAQALVPHLIDRDLAVHLAGIEEGHPDNSSASILGGAVISWCEDDNEPRYKAVRIPTHPGLRATALVPSTRASTSVVRKVLPENIPHVDARFNLARSALLTYALQHDPALLLEATKDKLHQGYRAEALPVTTEWVARMRDAGLAAFVSGAGPTALALHTQDFPAELAESASNAGLRVLSLDIAEGATAQLID